jgi:hypothetical protein
MKTLLLSLVLALAAETVVSVPSVTTSKLHGNRRTHQAGELIFSDEFDTLDLDTWQHEITMSGGGNWEFQVYWNNRSNSYVRDSTLFLRPTLTADRFGEDFVRTGTLDLWGGSPQDQCTMNAFYGCMRSGGGTNLVNPVASARLRTVNAFSFTYGRVEVRAKTPSGDWLWPAIWMLPADQAYGPWPTSGEIDIMESRGNRQYTVDGVNVGAEQVGNTLHYGVDYIMNGWPKATFATNTAPGAPWSDDFHRYQLEWTPDYMRFSIDDVETGMVMVPAGGFWEQGEFDTSFPGVTNPWAGQARNAPFDKDFFFVLNVAAGGVGYFPDNGVNVPAAKPWLNTSPQAAFDFYAGKDGWYPTWQGEDAAMQVDYVRVYAL